MVNIKILNKIKMKFLNLRSDSIRCWVRRPNTTRENLSFDSIRCWVPSLRFGKLRWDDKLVIANKFASCPSCFRRPNTTRNKLFTANPE